MAKAKKNTRKPNVTVRDMKAKKDPKGGATAILNTNQKWEPPQTPGAINFDVNSLNYKK